MKIHMVVDFQYNYYRNKFFFEHKGNGRRLSCEVDGIEIDTTYMYLTLKDIESYRKSLMTNKDGTSNEVYMSIAADSKPVDRKELDSNYKSNREGKLSSEDFDNIELTLKTLERAGYNVYRKYGYEADDLIYELVKKTKGDFDLTFIYTNDSDVLVNLDDTVGVQRFKSNLRKHILITKNNFSDMMETEFKCGMPYNCIVLYKCLVGDKSDKIPGVKGFGVKAFDRATEVLWNEKFDFENLTNPEEVVKAINILKDNGKLSELQVEEALHCLELVRPKEFIGAIERPELLDSDTKRTEAYSRYKMFSLIK